MQRRNFIRNTSLFAFAVSANGFIEFDGKKFTGDCETTTDIIGPYYRPNAPMRSNLLIPGDGGEVIQLSGIVKQKDCTTPLKGACVEIWHCDAKGVYDNDSKEFRYRARTCCDDKGKYSFTTVFPVPYKAGENSWRPAHYHLLISAPGYQSLVTQIYFTGDEYLSKDEYAASPQAKKRILDIQKNQAGERSVTFNVSMLEKLPADPAVLKRIAGVYSNDKNEKAELFVKNELLWLKDNTPTGGDPLMYEGNNLFKMYGANVTVHFEILSDSKIKATVNWKEKGNEMSSVYVKS